MFESEKVMKVRSASKEKEQSQKSKSRSKSGKGQKYSNENKDLRAPTMYPTGPGLPMRETSFFDMNSNIVHSAPSSNVRSSRRSRTGVTDPTQSRSESLNTDEDSSTSLTKDPSDSPKSRVKSKARSSRKTSPSRSRESVANKTEQEEGLLHITSAEGKAARQVSSQIESVYTSAPGTPVNLSREGSMVRIVDEETGEVFFRKRSKSKLKKSSRESLPLTKQGSKPTPAPSPEKPVQHRHRRSNSSSRRKEEPVPDLDQISISLSDADNDNVGDILVCSNTTPLYQKRGSFNYNPFEDELEEEDDWNNPFVSTTKLGEVKGILKKQRSKSRSRSKTRKEDDDHYDTTSASASKDFELMQKNQPSCASLFSMTSQETLPPPPLNDDEKNNNNETASSVVTSRKKEKLKHVSKSKSKSPTPSESAKPGKISTVKDMPSRVLRQIFSYLDIDDLKTCGRVCFRWKAIADPLTQAPFIYRGKSPYGHFYSPHLCKDFVNFLIQLENKVQRPVSISFSYLNQDQAFILTGKLANNFKQAMKHMEVVSLTRCSLKWKAVLPFLSSFSKQLRSLTDDQCHFFSNHGPCCVRRQRGKAEQERKEFKGFKDSLKYLRILKIRRKAITAELPILFSVLTQGTKYLDEIEFVLGPNETPNGDAGSNTFLNLLSLFVKELKGLLHRNKDSLKIIRFSWQDSNFTGLFGLCLESLEKMRFSHLHTISLNFGPHSIKGKNVPCLKEFLKYHYARRLRYFSLERMILGEAWSGIGVFLEDFLQSVSYSLDGLDLKVLISDHFGPSKLASTHELLKLEPLRQFTTSIHFSIENEHTKSISQLFGREWHRKRDYPRVKTVQVTFQPGRKSYDLFNDFNIDLISSLFPNLAELRMSDRLIEHQQIFSPVMGQKLVTGVSNAQLENKDIQLICRQLVKLKVLKLWVNMISIDDHGMTGIHRGDISILHEDDQNFSWTNFSHEVVPSFSNLERLEQLSLRGLGPAVTDISLKFGFKSLDRLKVLELYGKLGVTKKGKQELRRRIKSYENNTIVKIKYFPF